MAVFGQAGVEQLYDSPFCKISQFMMERLHISEVIDIGARAVKPPDHLGRVPIKPLGQLSPERVSEQLQSCRFGLLNYDIARLEKSGVFAAYAVHGVIPVCLGSEADPPPGLEEGMHFLRWPLRKSYDVCSMQNKLVEWYNGHCIARHAELVSSWCLTEAKA
jgi:hypothetical protein